MEIYLGDGVYAEIKDCYLTIYTSNGVERTNEVHLGFDEYKRLIEFVKNKVDELD